jgi:predicted phosphodiesterase
VEKSMRIALLSDIHGNLVALEAIVADLKSRKPDLVVNLGDCVSGPLWPRETCDFLMAENWKTIRGNCDREVGCNERNTMSESDAFAWDQTSEPQRQWLANLPGTIALTEDVFACHGIPADDCDYLIDDIVSGQLCASSPSKISARLGDCAFAVILCGHSHVPRTCRASDGRLVINPGSVGLPAYESEYNGNTYVAEAGSPHARYAMLTKQDSTWSVEHLAIAYSHETAAQRALSNLRTDFAQALRTGTMR